MATETHDKPDLLVLGVHSESDGYPNVLYRLQDLRRFQQFTYREINIPFWRADLATRSSFQLIRKLLHAILAHAELLMRYLKGPVPQILYVPYPAIGVLAIMSMLPHRLRPRHIAADTFISIYDTVVNDRCLLARGNPLARLLHLVEKRACTFADINIVDTPENAKWLCNELGLDKNKVHAVTLSTDELHFRPNPYKANIGVLRILFVGTLVPLHGVNIIVEAAALLNQRKDIVFRLMGNGQEASHLEEAMQDSGATNIEWVRDWQSPDQIADEIERADICLGIFGKSAKAQRVCPFKIYVYSTVGRPIITGQTQWLQRTLSALDYTPFATVPVGNAAALASKIAELADNPTLRQQLADDSRRFYATHLSNKIAREQIAECLRPIRA